MSNTEIVRGIYEDFAKGDIPAVLGAFDENIEWNEAENFVYSDGNPYIGPNRILEGVFVRLGGEWDNFSALPEEIVDAGDIIIAIGRYTGRFKKSGKEVNAQFAHVWRLRDGKATSFQQYTDTAQFVQATGS
jgi:uncharacterized protein